MAKFCPLNTGLRDKELREIRWEQIDLVHKKVLTVGRSKSEAGTGRVIPLNTTALAALEAHAAWYIRRFGECKGEWFVFAFGSPLPNDPTRPITSFKTAWKKVREKAAVKGRWHDARHTLVTELAESGAGDELIVSIAGHVSRAMLSRYSDWWIYAGDNRLRLWGGLGLFPATQSLQNTQIPRRPCLLSSCWRLEVDAGWSQVAGRRRT